MGIRINELQLLDMIPEYRNKKKLLMAELGNQRLVIDGPNGYKGMAKDYFVARGIVHFSFDLNGKDGAIPVDLSKPIDDKWFDSFMIVTNSGTTEHITNGQEEAFRNIHNLCKVGGYMLHSNPTVNCWKNHCPHRYTDRFIRELGEANGYEIIFDDVNLRWGREYNIRGLYKKINNNAFCVSKKWTNEIETTKEYRINTDNLK
jgi:hypothetical protein